MNLYPTICNLCGGKVIYTSNATIYGKQYGSGYCYLCLDCRAFVGTHKPRPKEAFGILSNKEMRNYKKLCHAIFDSKWKTRKERQDLYYWLSKQLNIKYKDCHFGYFDLDMLEKAYEILKKLRSE